MLAIKKQQPERGGQRKYIAHMNRAREQGQEILHLTCNKSASLAFLIMIINCLLLFSLNVLSLF